MARIRSVKPQFFGSLDIAALPISTRLTYIGLWCYADDKGRGIDDARLIKAEVWPLDGAYSLKKVEKDMELLAAGGQVERYEVNGRRFFRVRSWHTHQHPNRPQPSRLPRSPQEVAAGNKPPPDPDPFSEPTLSDHGGRTNGARSESRGEEMEGSVESDSSRAVTQQGPPKPVEKSHGSAPNEMLVRALVDACRNRGPSVKAEARAVVSLLSQHVAEHVIDEAIGYCATLVDRPHMPRYLLSVVPKWAAERGVAVPELTLESA